MSFIFCYCSFITGMLQKYVSSVRVEFLTSSYDDCNIINCWCPRNEHINRNLYQAVAREHLNMKSEVLTLLLYFRSSPTIKRNPMVDNSVWSRQKLVVELSKSNALRGRRNFFRRVVDEKNCDEFDSIDKNHSNMQTLQSAIRLVCYRSDVSHASNDIVLSENWQ